MSTDSADQSIAILLLSVVCSLQRLLVYLVSSLGYCRRLRVFFWRSTRECTKVVLRRTATRAHTSSARLPAQQQPNHVGSSSHWKLDLLLIVNLENKPCHYYSTERQTGTSCSWRRIPTDSMSRDGKCHGVRQEMEESASGKLLLLNNLKQ